MNTYYIIPMRKAGGLQLDDLLLTHLLEACRHLGSSPGGPISWGYHGDIMAINVGKTFGMFL